MSIPRCGYQVVFFPARPPLTIRFFVLGGGGRSGGSALPGCCVCVCVYHVVYRPAGFWSRGPEGLSVTCQLNTAMVRTSQWSVLMFLFKTRRRVWVTCEIIVQFPRA